MCPMPAKREKVVVAMSGGVDSSVAACLLVEQGYDVMGLFMRVGARERATDSGPHAEDAGESEVDNGGRVHRGCCSAGDASDARFVAGQLGIPFYALNFQEDFDKIIDYFADEYVRGRTPNPCVVCNDRLKFGKLVDYADTVGARYIATGHYARIGRCSDAEVNRNPGGMKPAARKLLRRARDRWKDQSYVLFGLSRTVLDRVMFPIGEYTKAQVRELAANFALPNRDKPDSVDICFVPDRDYARVVRERRPEAFAEGDVVDSAGEVIGRHRGIGCYTIGQRRGLGIAAGKPIYVTQLDVAANTVSVGDADALLRAGLVAENAHFLVDVPDDSFRADVKIRYLHTAAPATVHMLGDKQVRVVFDHPQRAITPGQAVVFYDGETLLGGAWINRAEPPMS